MPKLSEQHPDAFQEWVAAGGVETAFELHLKLSRQIPAAPEDCLKISRDLCRTMAQTIDLFLSVQS